MTVRVLFLSVRNACRSQMAEAWCRALAHPDKVSVASAGLAPAQLVDETAVVVMEEVGLDLSAATPRRLTPELESAADLVIAVAPPPLYLTQVGNRAHDAWLLDESFEATPDRVRALRDDIERLVRRLLVSRRWLPYGASAPVYTVNDQSFTCVDCGKVSPPTDEGETITRQHGWRVMRHVLEGVMVVEARCPECYVRAKSSLPPTVPRSRRPGG